METNQAIQHLLFLEDCVIIPGLGGFVSQYRPAMIDQATGTFAPPAKEIVFNSELVQNDGTLVRFIAEKSNISPNEARIMVDQYVHTTRETLNQGGCVMINGIGQFQMDRDDHVCFRMDPGTNLFLESYGLVAFHLPEVTRETPARTRKQALLRPEESPRTVEFALKAKSSTPGRTFRRIAIAVPVLIACSLIPNHSQLTRNLISSKASLTPETSLFRLDYPEAVQKDTSRLIVYPITDSTLSVDTLTAEVTPVPEARVTPKTVEVQPIPTKESEGKYSVIAGCFKIKENAERLCKRLSDKGYPATITPSRNGLLFKVKVQSYATQQEALNGLSRIKKAEPGLDVWVAL